MAKVQQDEGLLAHATQAGEVAQAVFYTILFKMWSYDIGSVRIINNHDGDLILIEIFAGAGVDVDPERKSTCERQAGGWLVKFPDKAFSRADVKIGHAVLADQSSLWAFVCMQSVVRMLFQDLVDDADTDIKEVVHYLQSNVPRLILHRSRFGFGPNKRTDLPYPDFDAKGDVKGVYQITLKDGSKVSLDLSGGQYYMTHPTTMDWDAYVESWCSSIKYHVPFQAHYNKHLEKMSSYRYITALTINMEQIGHFNILLSNCKFELGFDLKELPFRDHSTFSNAKEKLIRAAHASLEKVITELDEGQYRESLVAKFDLRHPKVVATLAKNIAHKSKSIPYNIGDINKFDWKMLRELIRMSDSEVKYKEKKKLRLLLRHRCAYKLPEDWRIVFLQDSLPSVNIPWSFMSENPYWKGK